jgi:hypothetical protein
MANQNVTINLIDLRHRTDTPSLYVEKVVGAITPRTGIHVEERKVQDWINIGFKVNIRAFGEKDFAKYDLQFYGYDGKFEGKK